MLGVERSGRPRECLDQAGSRELAEPLDRLAEERGAMEVEVKRSGAVVIVTINRPERRNALNGDAIVGIGAAFVAAEEDATVRVVILTGAGDRAFCAGMDRSRERRRGGRWL
jgi:1,4-dihydroxy-2-naphthoyl-CoA synthase